MGLVSGLSWDIDPTGLGLEKLCTTTSIGRENDYKLVSHEGTVRLEYVESGALDDDHADSPAIIAGNFTGCVSAYILLGNKSGSGWVFSDSVELFFHNNLLVGVMSHRYCLWTYKGWNRKKLQAVPDFEIYHLPLLPNQRLLRRFDVRDEQSLFAPKQKSNKKTNQQPISFSFAETENVKQAKFMDAWVKEMLS
jgi:hypothetical protein